MRKFLASLVIIILCFNNFAFWAYNQFESWDKTKAVKELIFSKTELSNSYKWKKYIKIIDKFIEINRNNETELLKMFNKISPILEEWKIKNKESLNILKYMNARTVISLVNLYNIEPQEIIDEASTISETDKKIIEDKIVKLQLNILEKWATVIESITQEFENISNYEETWDFEMAVNLDYESLWEFKWNLKINDYSSKTSGFDTQLKWEIEAFINALPKWEKEIKLKLNSMIDFISKDWNIYLLLEKFNILEQEWVDEIKGFLNKAKEISQKNKYIKYSDSETQAGMNALKLLNPTNLVTEYKAVLSKPLVSAYKKQWDRYYLMPTKYACDEFKKLSNKLDPLNPSTCTESQYKSLVKDINNAWNFYAEILDNGKTKIGFIWNKKIWIQKNELSIIFDDSKIIELNYVIDWWIQWILTLNYINGDYLNLKFNSGKDVNLSFKSELNTKNKFEKIDFSFDSNNSYEKYNGKLSLENNIINWSFLFGNSNLSEKLSWIIKWKTNSNDDLSELDITYKWTEDNKEFLNWSISLWNSKVMFKNNYETENNKSDILISADLDKNYLPINWKIKINAYQKWGEYDYNTDKYIYDKNFSEVLKINIDINNKVIIWTTSISDKWEQIISINHSWNYDLNKFKLNNKFKISEKYSQYFNPDWSATSWNFNIDIDKTNNKNNVSLLANLLFWTKEVFNFSMKNVWKTEFNKVTIPTPKNTIDFKEIEKEIQKEIPMK